MPTNTYSVTEIDGIIRTAHNKVNIDMSTLREELFSKLADKAAPNNPDVDILTTDGFKRVEAFITNDRDIYRQDDDKTWVRDGTLCWQCNGQDEPERGK